MCLLYYFGGIDAWKWRLAFQRQSLLDEDSEDDLTLRILINNLGMENEIPEKRSSRDSRPGKKANVNREGEDGHKRIMKDYFAKDLMLPPEVF
jgi:hypothetical protein